MKDVIRSSIFILMVNKTKTKKRRYVVYFVDHSLSSLLSPHPVVCFNFTNGSGMYSRNGDLSKFVVLEFCTIKGGKEKIKLNAGFAVQRV